METSRWMMAAGLLAAHAFSANPLLQNMQANTWMAAPNSKIRPLCPSENSCAGITAIEGCGAVVWSWSGGAFDTKRNRMIVWGGGHSAYMGNEMYAFDLDNLTWTRVTEPTCPQSQYWSNCQDPLADGNPAGRHTYDGLAYLENTDAFFAHGGSLSCALGSGTRITWAFDFVSGKWANQNPGGTKPGQGQAYSLTCAYDPQSGKVFMRDPYSTYAYTPAAKAWVTLNNDGTNWTDVTSAIDTKRRLLFTAGNGEWFVYDIGANQIVTGQWATSGGGAVTSASAPGLAYDPVSDNLLALTGSITSGYTIYELNMATKAWTQKAHVSVVPPQEHHGGTYGRFRYSPAENAFVFVSAVDDNVFIYKHTAGGGVAAESVRQKHTPAPAIFPNPAVTSAKVGISGWVPGASTVKIIDVAGRVATDLTSRVKNGTAQWEMRGAAAGIYTVVVSIQGRRAVRTLLVSK